MKPKPLGEITKDDIIEMTKRDERLRGYNLPSSNSSWKNRLIKIRARIRELFPKSKDGNIDEEILYQVLK